MARSKNLADQRMTNLFATVVDTKSGKQPGALYLTPGLLLLATCGVGPIRGQMPFQNLLYVVSGSEVYSITANYIVTLVGSIPSTGTGPVSMINNGTQLAIFDGQNGFMVPGGYPLTGGTISDGGSKYAIGDTIILQATDGQQNAAAKITVTGVDVNGAVTAFAITLPGAFNPKAGSFTQAETSGSGTDFVLTVPTYGALVNIYTLTLPFVGPVSAAYQDGFGVVNEAGTDIWYQSDLFDLSVWEPLNFSSADALPDDIVALAELHRQIYVLKTNETEVWVNAGLPGFTFQRLDGVLIHTGCAATFSPALVGEALAWLSRTEQGQGIVMAATGYEPARISTHAIEDAVASYSRIDDAIGYAYQQGGHVFYVLIFPSGNATWVYDFSTKLWHQRAAFANGEFSRHWSNCYAFFAGQHIVGDYRNGNIYALSMDEPTDNGIPRKWVRSWRALSEPIYDSVSFDSLQIDMETGTGVPDGTNPLVVLRWSDDGGHNWSDERFGSAGKVGETALRVMFRRLGSTRLNSGLDRIFELSSNDIFFVSLIGADLQ